MRFMRDLEVRGGTGPKPLPGQSVTVGCMVWGKEKDTFRHLFRSFGGKNFTFKIGEEASLIKGLHERVLRMRVGEIANLRCSPGDVCGCFKFIDREKIKPYSIVALEIELLAVKEGDEERKDDGSDEEGDEERKDDESDEEGDEERKDGTPLQKKQIMRIRGDLGVKKRPTKPLPGQSVTVNITGLGKERVHDPFRIFWRTFDPGEIPFTFKIGQGSVIKGWDECVFGLQVGHVAHLRCSPDDAHRAHGLFGYPDWVIQTYPIVEFVIQVLAIEDCDDENDEERKDDAPLQSKLTTKKPPHVSPAIYPAVLTKSQTTKVVDQSAAKRKKHNDESEPTPRKSKRQHNPLANVNSTISTKTISKDHQNLDIVGPTTATQEAFLAPHIAPINVAPAIQKTITLASEGVAQDSDPSKSLSHALGLTEVFASSSPSGDDKGDPSKDINPENLAPNSHGTSPSKRANEEQKSPKHFGMDLLEMGNLDSEDLTLLDINVQDYSSTIFDDPIKVVDRFLSKVSSSHSQLSAPAATVSEIASSLHAELLSEFRSVAFTDNFLETLKQGQDPTIRLQTIKNEIKSNKELFTQGQLDEVESTVKFLNEFSSAYKRLGALHDSKGSIQQDIASSSRKLQQTGVKLSRAKESNRSHQSELSSVESRIKELEDELRKLNTRKESLQSESSTHDAKIEADMKSIEQLMRLILRDKARLFKAEKESEYAKGVFDEHEKKYQALRNSWLYGRWEGPQGSTSGDYRWEH